MTRKSGVIDDIVFATPQDIFHLYGFAAAIGLFAEHATLFVLEMFGVLVMAVIRIMIFSKQQYFLRVFQYFKILT